MKNQLKYDLLTRKTKSELIDAYIKLDLMFDNYVEEIQDKLARLQNEINKATYANIAIGLIIGAAMTATISLLWGAL